MMYVIVPRVVTRLVGIGPSDFHTMTSMESSCAFLKKISKKNVEFQDGRHVYLTIDKNI